MSTAETFAGKELAGIIQTQEFSARIATAFQLIDEAKLFNYGPLKERISKHVTCEYRKETGKPALWTPLQLDTIDDKLTRLAENELQCEVRGLGTLAAGEFRYAMKGDVLAQPSQLRLFHLTVQYGEKSLLIPPAYHAIQTEHWQYANPLAITVRKETNIDPNLTLIVRGIPREKFRALTGFFKAGYGGHDFMQTTASVITATYDAKRKSWKNLEQLSALNVYLFSMGKPA